MSGLGCSNSAAVYTNSVEDRHDEPNRIDKAVDAPKDFKFNTLGLTYEYELVDSVTHRHKVVDEPKNENAECLHSDTNFTADSEPTDTAVDDSEVVKHREDKCKTVYHQGSVEYEVQEVGMAWISAAGLLVDGEDDISKNEHPEIVDLSWYCERLVHTLLDVSHGLP